jgi:tetratricopeptide (TPR) repeat protein
VITIDRTRWSRYRDEQDPEPGYDGMLAGQAESPDGHFIAWTPGRLVTAEPEYMAWRLDRGSDIVLQLHMMPTGRRESVSVKIGLFLTKHAPTRFPLMLRIGSTGIDIASERREYSTEDQFILPVDVEGLSVYPHAHNLARTMTAFARLPDGSVRPLVEIPRWDFHWQDEYRYAKPIALPRGTTIAMRYTYDNSSDNPHNPQHPPARVVYGPRTSDEMGDLWLQVLPATAADRTTLAAALAQRETLAQIKGAETTLLARPDDAITRTLLGSLYAHVGRVIEAERQYRRAIEIDPAVWTAHYNLGAALQSSGRIETAVSEYRSALAINPHAAEAHHAIGSIAYLAGRLDEAMREYREALQIWGDYADAHNSLGNALAKVGRNADAVSEYRTVLNIQPDHVPALNNLGILLARLGEIDEAVRVLQRAVEIAPTDRTSLTNLTAARDLAKARRKQ